MAANSKASGFSWADEVEKEEAEAQAQAQGPRKSNPFGSARPREIVLQEKGINWRKLDEQLRSSNIRNEKQPAATPSANEQKRYPSRSGILATYPAQIQQMTCPAICGYQHVHNPLVPPLRYPPKNVMALMENGSQCLCVVGSSASERENENYQNIRGYISGQRMQPSNVYGMGAWEEKENMKSERGREFFGNISSNPPEELQMKRGSILGAGFPGNVDGGSAYDIKNIKESNFNCENPRGGQLKMKKSAKKWGENKESELEISSQLGLRFESAAPIMLARLFHGRPAYNNMVLLIKCFAAGVILSTSLVHVLPDAFEALADCQVASRHPWKDFPFSGFIALMGALAALLVDIAASSHAAGDSHYTPVVTEDPVSAAAKKMEEAGVLGCHELQQVDELAKMKQRLVSQVLEIGIIFHSVIIGVTLGMSQNKCTIRPLVFALSFHQIFEGMGLGGCIAQAGFNFATVVYMCLMFSVTTPMGILLGMMVFRVTGYDDNSPNALVLEGVLGSFSSGILIYMALVDLIAVDFFHNKLMTSNAWLKKGSYICLIAGSASMSVLALWA